MAITFTNDRYFRTDVGNKIFQNVPTASQWFKILVTGANPQAIPGNDQCGFLAKVIFDFWHAFEPTPTTTTVNVRFHLVGASGSGQVNIPLTIGGIYGIAVTWDGVAGSQKVWVNGIPTQFGTVAGTTQNNSSALQFGVSVPNTNVVFALDDHNVWDNYLLTSADIANLLNGTDPTTIGTSATWRGRWTLAGTTAATATIGDAGLKNAFGGGGSLSSGGDGSDCISAAGAGSAVYAPTLVWAPTVLTTPAYIDTCGKVAVVFFKSLVNQTQVSPSQLLATPTISVNGVNKGPLGTPWFTGYHPFAWYPLPSGVHVAPTDTVTLSAPTAWANTPAGAVEAMNSLAITNLVGQSVVRPSGFQPTFDIGLNNPQSPMSSGLSYYQPLANWKYLVGWPPGNRGKFTQNFAGITISNLNAFNGIDQTLYPGAPGLWLAMWDTANPAQPAIGTFKTNSPSYTTCTERVDLRQRPSNGIGYACVFDFENIPGNTAGVGGSYVASVDVAFGMTDPSGNPSTNYSNLFVVAPGDWRIVGGVPVFDRSDPFVLSNRYLSRVPQNVGSLRWVDSGPVGGNPTSFPYPENLQSKTNESWSNLSGVSTKIGFNSFGPVNVTATPYIYSPALGKPGALGQTFSATLATAITTTPPSGTQETWNISDGATAPLMAGLEMEIDSEIVRIISGSGTAWVVYRGSNGTTPATHAAGTLRVFGRTPITSVLNSSGGDPNAIVIGAVTSVPHGITTGHQVLALNGMPSMTFTSGETGSFIPRQVYVTGPNTMFELYGSSVSTGGVPVQTYTTNPATAFWQRNYPESQAAIPHEVQAIITGKFPNANYHCNIWPDASDDCVYEVARRVLANFPSGRKVYVEYDNEPWNFGFTGFYYHTGLMGPLVVPSGTFPLEHYVYRALQVHDIFRAVFATVGRQGEIMGIVNCQQGSSQPQDYLTYAASQNKTIDAVAHAPYVSTEPTTLNANFVNTIDDEQAISMWIHDLWYNPNTYNAYATLAKSQIAAYNKANGKNCILMAYEGGVEFVPPPVQSIVHQKDERNRDCCYNPNFYIAEQDFYAWLQMQGYDHLHIYALAMFWQPAGWGMYHGIAQDHGRGDGSDGKANNLLCRANPTATHYKGTNVNQDANVVSVRGQALIDWLGSIGQSPPPPPPPPPPPATAYTVTAPTPASGLINTASGNFTVQPNGPYTGTITITPSGGGLSTPVVRTWANSSAPQTFVITPTVIGAITLTVTNSGLLTDIGSLTYQCTAAPPPSSKAPWWGAWFGRWFTAGSSTASGNSNPTSATGGVVQGGASAVSFLDVDAPRLRHRFVPWSRRSYRTRGR